MKINCRQIYIFDFLYCPHIYTHTHTLIYLRLHVCIDVYIADLADRFLRSDCLSLLSMPMGQDRVCLSRQSRSKLENGQVGRAREAERGRGRKQVDRWVGRRWIRKQTMTDTVDKVATKRVAGWEERANPCNILSFYGNWRTWKDFHEQLRLRKGRRLRGEGDGYWDGSEIETETGTGSVGVSGSVQVFCGQHGFNLKAEIRKTQI